MFGNQKWNQLLSFLDEQNKHEERVNVTCAENENGSDKQEILKKIHSEPVENVNSEKTVEHEENFSSKKGRDCDNCNNATDCVNCIMKHLMEEHSALTIGTCTSCTAHHSCK